MAARRSGSRLRRLTQIVAMALAAILVGNGSAAQLSASVAGVEWLIFRNATLGLSFAYPAGWVATAGCHGSRTCVGISEGKRGVDDYTLALEVFPGGLERVAIDKSVFRPRPGGWVAHGRSSEHPVEAVVGEGWRGLQAVVDCGISDRSIVHAAAGECLWTVLSDGRTSVVADTQGSSPVTEVVRRIIRSVRFVRQ
jgi:hypothetical protein